MASNEPVYEVYELLKSKVFVEKNKNIEKILVHWLGYDEFVYPIYFSFFITF